MILAATPIFDEVAKLYPELVWDQPYELLRTWDGTGIRMILTDRLMTL